jgi:hypothetical protein
VIGLERRLPSSCEFSNYGLFLPLLYRPFALQSGFFNFDWAITFASGVSVQWQLSRLIGVYSGGLEVEGCLSNYGLGDEPRLGGVWFGVYFRRSAYMAPL